MDFGEAFEINQPSDFKHFISFGNLNDDELSNSSQV